MIRRRKPIARSRKRIPFRSEKTAGRLDERIAVVDQAWARDRGLCRARPLVGGRCGGPLDAHEIIPRSAWREGQFVVANVVMVCRTHHRWIDDHPAEAHAVGLHGFSYERLRIVGEER